MGLALLLERELKVVTLLILAVLALLVLGGGIVADVLLFKRARRRRRGLVAQIRRLCGRKWSWEDGGLILASLSLCQLIFYGVLTICRPQDATDVSQPPLWAVVGQTTAFNLAGFGVIWAILELRRRSWRSAFGLCWRGVRRDLRAGLLYYLAAMPLFAMIALGYRGLLDALHIKTTPQDVLLFLGSPEHPVWVKAYLAVVAVTLAPVVEELLFRGIAFPLFARHMGLGWAIGAVSLFFAAIHFSLSAFVPLFAIAVGFSLAYLCSGSILVPILMHAVFNAVNLAVMYLVSHSAIPLWN
ncbi:MAG: lysostaphin resistance A-like protein [Kiritimatiellia bacterium]